MSLRKHYFLPVVLLLVGSVVCIADKTQKDELKIPSEDVIKSFVSSAKGTSSSNTVYQFNVSFKPGSTDLYRFGGKITFAIAVEMMKKIKTEEGDTDESVFDGKANIVVVDADGKIVGNKQEDLSALCPS